MSTKADQKVEQAKPAPAKAPYKSLNVVYLGPTIKNVAQHGTVYTDGILTQALKDFVSEKPFVNSLIVPVSKYAETAAAIEKVGTALNTLYNRALQ